MDNLIPATHTCFRTITGMPLNLFGQHPGSLLLLTVILSYSCSVPVHAYGSTNILRGCTSCDCFLSCIPVCSTSFEEGPKLAKRYCKSRSACFPLIRSLQSAKSGCGCIWRTIWSTITCSFCIGVTLVAKRFPARRRGSMVTFGTTDYTREPGSMKGTRALARRAVHDKKE